MGYYKQNYYCRSSHRIQKRLRRLPTDSGGPTNVLPLRKSHHAAFDPELFTIGRNYRLHVSPDSETDSDLLEQTIVDRTGESVPQLYGNVAPTYLRQHNDSLGWLTN
ncbi:HNH endonuclease [Haloarcula japonica]|uniref:HNH endonuclease n=1 Tax=Haloarcula japonica TaxID=29282 RepID=UPI0039F72316